MSYSRLFLFFLVLFSLIILSENVLAYTCTGTDYTGSGDWLINNNTFCSCSSGENITINGNVYVYGTGNFTLDNCILWMNQTTNYQYKFETNDTSKINITDSIVNSSYSFNFNLRGNSTNIITNFLFSESLVPSFFESSNNTIKNSTFYRFFARFFDISINTIINSTFTLFTEFDGNSTNIISNSSFIAPVNFDDNSSNTILDSNFDSTTDFLDKSINTMQDSFSYNVELYDYSQNKILNSSLNIISIYSSVPHNLTISNLSSGNFITNYIKADDSSFTINLTNVNMGGTYFYANDGNNTIINSKIYGWSVYGSSINYVKNSTISGSTAFWGSSNNTILNTTFTDTCDFYGSSNNKIINSNFTNQIRFYEYSVNNISGTNFSYITYFYQNSTNTIKNTAFGGLLAGFHGNSINMISNSTFIPMADMNENSSNIVTDSSLFHINFFDNSSNTVIRSLLNTLAIRSSIPHNLTITNLYPSNFTTKYIKADDSTFSINLTDTNITEYRLDGYSNSNNIIINSTFSQGRFYQNSYNSIVNSTFTLLTEFYDYSNNNIMNSVINTMPFRSSAPHNLTISNLYPGNFITNYIKADDSSFTINLTNVNITNFGFISLSTSTNAITNSMFNYFCEFGSYSTNNIINTTFNNYVYFWTEYTNTIINSTFNYATYFYSLSNNTIQNTNFTYRIYFGYVYGTNNLLINFMNSLINDSYVYQYCNATIKGNYTILGNVTSWISGGNITRYLPLYVYYNTGNPISAATVSVKDNSSSTVWQGSTNSNGYVEPMVIFNATNYGHGNFTLSVQKDGYTNSTDIHFLTNTSILLTLPYVPPSTTTTIPSGPGGDGGPTTSCKKENQACTSNSSCCSGLYCMNSLCKNVTIISGETTTTTTLTTTETTIATTAISLTTTTTVPVKSFLKENTIKILIIGGLMVVIVFVVILSHFMVKKPKVIVENIGGNSFNLSQSLTKILNYIEIALLSQS